MNITNLTPRTASGIALEQALAEWMDASRRAYDPARDQRDEQAEHVAWCRVQSALTSADVLAAA
jgi:hypothetical protein